MEAPNCSVNSVGSTMMTTIPACVVTFCTAVALIGILAHNTMLPYILGKEVECHY